MLVGDLRGLGATRVEHDHPPAAGVQVAHALREVGHRHQRAVGGHRVGADDQEPRRAVDVGDRQEELVAEHQVRHELVGELVDRGGGVAVLRPEGLEHRGAVRHRAEAVGVGVAEVDAERVVAVLVDRPAPGCRRPGRRPRPSRSPPTARPVPRRRGARVGAAGRGRRTRRRWRRPWGSCARARAGRPGCRARRRPRGPRSVSSRPQIASQRLQTPIRFCSSRAWADRRTPREGTPRGVTAADAGQTLPRPVRPGDRGASPTEWSTSWVSEGRSASSSSD